MIPEHILQLLNASHPQQRAEGILQLLYEGCLFHQREASYPLILEKLQDPDLQVRVQAIQLLASFDQDKVKPILLELLHDPDWEIQWASTHSLGQIWSDVAVRKAGHIKTEKRVHGIEDMAAKQNAHYLPIFLCALDDEIHVQRAALKALQTYYEPEVATALQQAFDDAPQEIQAMIKEILHMRNQTTPDMQDADLSCAESGLQFPYAQMVHVGAPKTGRQWLAKPNIVEF
ncbi:MAG: HEAT repeat domain-containing protein, partial [Myxococcota bacterium]